MKKTNYILPALLISAAALLTFGGVVFYYMLAPFTDYFRGQLFGILYAPVGILAVYFAPRFIKSRILRTFIPFAAFWCLMVYKILFPTFNRTDSFSIGALTFSAAALSAVASIYILASFNAWFDSYAPCRFASLSGLKALAAYILLKCLIMGVIASLLLAAIYFLTADLACVLLVFTFYAAYSLRLLGIGLLGKDSPSEDASDEELFEEMFEEFAAFTPRYFIGCVSFLISSVFPLFMTLGLSSLSQAEEWHSMFYRLILFRWQDAADGVLQAVEAARSGGTFGTGFSSEMIDSSAISGSNAYALLLEHCGVVGAVFLIIVLAVLILCAVRITYHCSGLAKYVSFGITTHLFAMSLAGILGAVNILPIYSLSIPFFASAGTDTAVYFCELAILLTLWKRSFAALPAAENKNVSTPLQP